MGIGVIVLCIILCSVCKELVNIRYIYLGYNWNGNDAECKIYIHTEYQDQ